MHVPACRRDIQLVHLTCDLDTYLSRSGLHAEIVRQQIGATGQSRVTGSVEPTRAAVIMMRLPRTASDAAMCGPAGLGPGRKGLQGCMCCCCDRPFCPPRLCNLQEKGVLPLHNVCYCIYSSVACYSTGYRHCMHECERWGGTYSSYILLGRVLCS